ncbi:MAG: 4-hydroxy-3-methylbut-2-enyl diphosphate reductase [Cyanobacteria bacterium SIG30]|nr:4-hydroxy-3-methylbut-2-enyl diphosphate reductase [Cyanobacteria bacterium SIG30]
MTFITNKNIKYASYAGFCYGVKRAVETTKKIKKENPDKNIYVLGELIHNSQVIQELEEMGVKTVDNLPENGCGICIIRSHGVSIDTIKDIENKGFEIVDLTCPDVKKVQNEAVELVNNGYFLIILGQKEHPEVMAIEANAKLFAKNTENVFVACNLESLKNIEDKVKENKKVGVVVQTTQKIEYLKEVANYLIPLTKELKIINTICASTTLRQNEAKLLAQQSDLMIVIGSKKSANTTHLANILSNITKTIHIESDNELLNFNDDIEKAFNIGVTAGASTPDYIIQKVLEKLKEK